ncbi:MOSC domain-containing protein [Sphingomonas sp. HMP6]|uniref:MOSC domain-containing protein n=1 Tax=Sphingomonas sp. HMP6 TaxID=1517551 RepID=UPI001E46FDCC|nr:MOSC domain-containing protein [Sphingomonas sp. HMP6]
MLKPPREGVGVGSGVVVAVAADGAHRFAKPVRDAISLVAGMGVAGDADAGVTVQHRSRIARDPRAPNLRQVHLIHAELFAEQAAAGFDLTPGKIGENVLVRGVGLLGVPVGTTVLLGAAAAVTITGLRNPCRQLEAVQPGLMAALLGRAPDGALIRKGGVMAIVARGGDVRPGDTVRVLLPEGPFQALAPV